MIRSARNLKKETGIISRPGNRMGKSLPEETKDLVIDFYHDDEYSRQLPGEKILLVSQRMYISKSDLFCVI